jgi:hypothetical protein
MVGTQGSLLRRLMFFAVVWGVSCNMADKDKVGTSNEPGFARLAEGQGSFRAIVYDESNHYTLKDFSFFGSTAVGGVRRETDDSVTRFELSKIKELKVLKPHFDSKRFGDKDFLLAEVIASTGSVTSDLLVPKKMIICGIDEKSGLEKSWFLQKIDRIVMQGATPLVLPSIPSSISGADKGTSGTSAPVAPQPINAPAHVVPTAGSNEMTKRTYRPAKKNKWEAFYKNEQLPQGEAPANAQEKRSIGGAFIGVVDAIIDFFRALVNSILKLFK